MIKKVLLLLFLFTGMAVQSAPPGGTPIGGVINDYTEVLSYTPCNNALLVNNASKYHAGDTVLIIQMKGAVIDSTNTANFGSITNIKNAGNYEYNYVKQVTGNVIELKNQLTRAYDYATGKVQLVRVPYYTDAIVTSTLTCLPWDGSKGGVLAFNVQNTLQLTAGIDVSGKGFSGAKGVNTDQAGFNCENTQFFYPSTAGDFAAPKGEGIADISPLKSFGRGPLGNAGGGGNSHNSGGGGGSNATSGGNGGNQFEFCTSPPPFVNGGLPGRTLTVNNATNRIYLGGGGGAGHDNNPEGFTADGGNGGGICLITAGIIDAGGNSIMANGLNGKPCSGLGATGCHEGMGAGGAGGTIVLNAGTYSTPVNVIAGGGRGADMIMASLGRLGPGGGGSGGVCWLNNPSLPANVTINLAGGPNGVCTQYANDPWGSAPGQTGLNLFNLALPVDNTPFLPTTVKTGNDTTLCKGDSIQLNATGAITYTWSPATGLSDPTLPNPMAKPAGSIQYIVTGTDAAGCIAKDTILITIDTPLIKTVNDTLLCKGDSTLLSTTGGTVYSWTPAAGLSDPTLSNPIAKPDSSTQYIVSGTDSYGCKAKDTVIISIDTPFVKTINDTTLCRGDSVRLNTTGGNTYSWLPIAGLSDPSLPNPMAKPDSSTQYIVAGTNVHGCTAKDTVQITINFPLIKAVNDTTLCIGDSVRLNATGGDTYSWSPAAGLSDPTQPNPMAKPIGSIQYIVTGTNSIDGCTAKDTVIITIDTPLIKIINDTLLCKGDSTLLNTTGGIVYSWTPAAGLSDPTLPNPIAKPDSSTQYIVSGTDSYGCKAKDTVIISIDTPFVKTINDTTLCRGDSVRLNTTGGNTYSWLPIAGLSDPSLPNPMAKPDSSTQYIVAGTNVHGCTAKDTVQITINFPLIKAVNDTTLCIGDSVRLNATGGDTYSWSPAAGLSDPTQPNPMAKPTGSIQYIVTGTNSIDGCTAKDTVIITIDTPLVKTINNTLLCKGDSILLGTTGAATYSWTPAAGLSDPTKSNPMAKPDSTTQYIVTGTNTFGCIASDTVIISIDTPFVRTRSDTTLCNGDSVRLIATGGSIYTWTPATGLSDASLYNPLAKPAGSTQYIVSGINNFGCTASDTVFITVNPIPVVTVRIDTTICHDTPVQLWAQGGNIYSWQPAATLSNPLTSNPVAAPLQNTTYTVTVTDANQCTARAAVNITVIPPPVFSVTSNATVCLGTPVQLEAKGGDRYTWTPAADLSDPSAANPVANPSSLGANTYQVKINSAICADSTLLSVAVVILPVPEITATKSNDVDCTLPFSQLSASGAEYYTWSPAAGLNDSTIANPLGKPTVTTTYLVKGIAANGCPGTDSVTIKVSKTGDLLFNMPNAFTPNGDGHNDCFGAGRYAALVSSIELSVYNRWGNLVFHTTNPNDCWDGTYKGKLQDPGGFPFIIKAKTLCGDIIKKGIVILVR